MTLFPYHVNDSVLVGNGVSLPITHTSCLPLTLGSHKFQLNNVLHVPSLKKNLLSASQFTKDNSVDVTIHPFGQVMSNFYTGFPLF